MFFLFNTKSQDQGSAAGLASQVQQDVKEGAKLIDVRTPQEYAGGHAQNATNLTLQDIQQGVYPEGAKDQKIYLYCASGNRASQAKSALERAGYSDVTNLGGIADWQRMGGQIN